MYRQHQPVIAAWARYRPSHLARVIQFAMVSARVRFYNVPDAMERADRGDPGALFGWKAEGVAYARAQARDIYWHCEDIAASFPRRRERGSVLVHYLAHTVPGLELAKAGFVAQLAYGCAGCLDSVNARRLGLPDIFNGNSKYRIKHQATPIRRRNLARWYVATCEMFGGPGALWDEWCAEMSRTYPSAFPTAEDASAWHLKCLSMREED